MKSWPSLDPLTVLILVVAFGGDAARQLRDEIGVAADAFEIKLPTACKVVAEALLLSIV